MDHARAGALQPPALAAAGWGTGMAAQHLAGSLLFPAEFVGKTLDFPRLGLERVDQPDPRPRGTLHEPRQRLKHRASDPASG